LKHWTLQKVYIHANKSRDPAYKHTFLVKRKDANTWYFHLFRASRHFMRAMARILGLFILLRRLLSSLAVFAEGRERFTLKVTTSPLRFVNDFMGIL